MQAGHDGAATAKLEGAAEHGHSVDDDGILNRSLGVEVGTEALDAKPPPKEKYGLMVASGVTVAPPTTRTNAPWLIAQSSRA